MTRSTLLFLCATSLLTSCDNGSDTPDDEFRAVICIAGATPPPVIVAKTGKPNPEERLALLLQLAEEQTDEFMVAFASLEIDLEAECKGICAAEDYDWGGETCIGERDYTYGELENYQTARGEKRYRIPVNTGKTEVGCACQ